MRYLTTFSKTLERELAQLYSYSSATHPLVYHLFTYPSHRATWCASTKTKHVNLKQQNNWAQPHFIDYLHMKQSINHLHFFSFWYIPPKKLCTKRAKSTGNFPKKNTWVFPKMVLPPNHPFFFSGFPLYKPSILGETPLFLEGNTPCFPPFPVEIRHLIHEIRPGLPWLHPAVKTWRNPGTQGPKCQPVVNQLSV